MKGPLRVAGIVLACLVLLFVCSRMPREEAPPGHRLERPMGGPFRPG